ncbi:hypothetical protein MKW94_004748 [Papaver nudicaule]|uniref:HTH myb-type domain-containing protein n=1 Tax=Papaver nudicaule TaxID=74823 RepID=A0AA41SHV6_PAPNU|nr:hypothetical protein [Papaver nudicaule]
MLALAPLRNCNDERKGAEHHEMESSTFSIGMDGDFSTGNLLDDIDFDDLFVGMDYGDVLPDLELDPEILAEFSVSGSGEDSEFHNLSSSISTDQEFLFVDDDIKQNIGRTSEEDEDSGSGSGSCLSSRGDEIVSKRDDDLSSVKADNDNQSHKDLNKCRKSTSSSQSKGSSQGKRKVKVDWTPELHRRFVQAVEQLGMDKAVPSRILEIMGIDCLTRHNIASHLQKYRSHQKHLLAREAEAASWSQRRQLYGSGGAAARGNTNSKIRSENHHPHHNPWIAPTMGFPPPTPPNLIHPYRPLHVWGHPTVDPAAMHVWPKHLLHPSTPPPIPPTSHPRWPPPPPSLTPTSSPPDPSSYWHPNHHQRLVANNALTAGTPCYPHPQQLGTTRPISSAPLVPGIPPPAHATMYKVEHGIGGVPAQPSSSGFSSTTTDSGTHPPFDLLHPTKDKVDAAIGDVLTKPWLPLPLGLKPPSLDSVLVELQRQGIPEIPPTATASTSTSTPPSVGV